MSQEMLREADLSHKGFITGEELGHAILRASRLSRMVKAVQERWRDDENYVARPPPEGTFTNLETDQDVNRGKFAKAVEHGKLDNSDTRRRPDKLISYTWSGLPIYDEEDLMHKRSKTVKTRDLVDYMMHPHSDSRFRRLPLHFCCENALHPEAAVMMRDLLAAYERAAQIKDANGQLPLHLAARNESYTSGTMVRLLLKTYPLAAQIREPGGYLPLHLCLMHNHGDAALDLVTLLLDVYPRAAKVRCGPQLRYMLES